MKKPLLIFFFVSLVIFNILNVIDKITTYYGIKQGFIELNSKSMVLINTLGLILSQFLFIFIGIIASISFYLGIKKLSEKIANLDKIIIVPILFLIGIYTEAIINNIKWLLG